MLRTEPTNANVRWWRQPVLLIVLWCAACSQQLPDDGDIDAMGLADDAALAAYLDGLAPTRLDVTGSRTVSWHGFASVDTSRLQFLTAQHCLGLGVDIGQSLTRMPKLTGLDLYGVTLSPETAAALLRHSQLSILTLELPEVDVDLLVAACAGSREHLLLAGGAVLGSQQQMEIGGTLSGRLLLLNTNLGSVNQVIVTSTARIGMLDLRGLTNAQGRSIMWVFQPGAQVEAIAHDSTVIIAPASMPVLQAQGTGISRQ